MDELTATTLTELLNRQAAPVLTWFSPREAPNGEDGTPGVRERIELSGPVARRWIAKTDNFLASEFPFAAESFTTYFPSPHWREPFWITACWLRGMHFTTPRRADTLDLAVSSDLTVLQTMQEEVGPDVLVAQNTQSLALSWPEDLPFGISDGIADVMTFGDFVEMPQAPSPPQTLIAEVPREDLDAADTPLDFFPAEHVHSCKRIVLGDLTTDAFVDRLGQIEKGERIILTTRHPVVFTAQLIQLWLKGAAVIWVPGGEGVRSIATAEHARIGSA